MVKIRGIRTGMCLGLEGERFFTLILKNLVVLRADEYVWWNVAFQWITGIWIPIRWGFQWCASKWSLYFCHLVPSGKTLKLMFVYRACLGVASVLKYLHACKIARVFLFVTGNSFFIYSSICKFNSTWDVFKFMLTLRYMSFYCMSCAT